MSARWLIQNALFIAWVLWTCLWPHPSDAAAPTNAPTVKVYDQKPGQLLLYWSSVPLASSYRVTVDTGNGPTVLTSTQTKLTLIGLPQGHPLTFTVQGVNPDGDGPIGTSSFTQATSPPTATVADLKFMTTLNGRVVLRWLPTPQASLHRLRLQNTSAIERERLWVTGSVSVIIGQHEDGTPRSAESPVLHRDHQYRVFIRGINAAGWGPETDFSAKLDHADPPPAPQQPIVTITSPTSALLSWNPNPATSLMNVYVGDNPSTLLSQPPIQAVGTTVSVTGLQGDRPYYAVLRGQNNRGASAPSPVRLFRTVSPPVAPVIAVTTGAVPVVAWVADPTVTRYVLEYQSGGTTNVIDPATSPMSLSGLPASTPVTARVKAINPSGETWSNQVQWTTPPPAPSIFQTVAGSGRVTLHWTPVPDATGYVVYTAPGTTPAHSRSDRTTDTHLTIEGLSHGTYTFVVTAKSGMEESPDSDPTTAAVDVIGASRLYNGPFGNAASTLLEGASLSATGRFALFFTNALNLSDLNTGNSLMVYDQHLGTLDFVGNIGTSAGKGRHAITPDGTVTVFTSNDSTLVFDDFNNATDVFLSDITTGELIRVSVDESGQEIPGTSTTPYLSDDGNEILFLTSGLGGGSKPYLHHRLLGFSEPGLITLTGQDGTGEPCGLSADGQVLAVLATTTSATDLDPDTRFRNRKQLYVRNLQTGITRGESASSDIDRDHFINGTPATDHVTACALAHDASFVAFETVANNLVTDDTNAKKDVFLRDLTTGATDRVSITQAGGQLTDDATLINIVRPRSGGVAVIFKTKAPVRQGDPTFAAPRYYAWYRNPTGTATIVPLLDPAAAPPTKLSVSRDGSTMAMEAAAPLLAGDTNGVADIYLDQVTGLP